MMAASDAILARIVFHANSIDLLIQLLVIQATAHRKEHLAELAGMRGDFVPFEGTVSTPYLDQRQMIGPAALLQYVVAQNPGIMRAVDAQLLDGGKAFVLFHPNEIDMRQYIHGAHTECPGLADRKAGVQALIDWRCEIGLEPVA